MLRGQRSPTLSCPFQFEFWGLIYISLLYCMRWDLSSSACITCNLFRFFSMDYLWCCGNLGRKNHSTALYCGLSNQLQLAYPLMLDSMLPYESNSPWTFGTTLYPPTEPLVSMFPCEHRLNTLDSLYCRPCGAFHSLFTWTTDRWNLFLFRWRKGTFGY